MSSRKGVRWPAANSMGRIEVGLRHEPQTGDAAIDGSYLCLQARERRASLAGEGNKVPLGAIERVTGVLESRGRGRDVSPGSGAQVGREVRAIRVWCGLLQLVVKDSRVGLGIVMEANVLKMADVGEDAAVVGSCGAERGRL